MKRLVAIFAFAAFLGTAFAAYAEEDGKTLLEDGKKLFADKKYPKAMDSFTLAKQRGVSGKDAEELALYMGGIYVLQSNRDKAIENFNVYLRMNPTASAPESFTDQIKGVLEEARSGFPIPNNIQVGAESFKPYKETLPVTFTIAGSRRTIEGASVFIRFMDSTGKSTLYEKEVKIDLEAERKSAEWNGMDKNGAFLAPGKYLLAVRTVRKQDGWACMSRIPVVVGGNVSTPECKRLTSRAARARLFAGKLPVEIAEGKKRVRIKTEPMISTSKGDWNLLYYVCVGSIRDGLDFPVKYLCSTPYMGHALTVALPVAGAYSIGKSAYSLDRADYYDPLAGYDEDAWQSDSQAADVNAASMTILAPVWALAYGGLMSVVSWAGTDDGIEKGFYSYIDSNAFNRGYEYKYFFPNYRSLNFSDKRVDDEALSEMQQKVNDMNVEADVAVKKENEMVRKYNVENIQPIGTELDKKISGQLFDFAEIRISVAK